RRENPPAGSCRSSAPSSCSSSTERRSAAPGPPDPTTPMDDRPSGYACRAFARRAWLVIWAASLAACAPPGPQVEGLPDRVDYNLHVKPILSDRCFKCHGPDDAVRQAGLRLDTPEGPLLTLASGV